MKEKLQKVLARIGLGSRRNMEAWIKAGRITINDVVAKLGDRVLPEDKICIDGRPIKSHSLADIPIRALLYHKPEGEICSRFDPEGRSTVFERLPNLTTGRWVAVGRLDYNTSGLLLFTNNGDLAHKLMHPSANIEREYAVRIYGKPTPETLEALAKGIQLPDGMARFTSIKSMEGESSNRWFKVTVNEGKNRIVRRLWESQNLKVNRLIRIRFGLITLPTDLPPGAYAEFDNARIQQLLSMCEYDIR